MINENIINAINLILNQILYFIDNINVTIVRLICKN